MIPYWGLYLKGLGFDTVAIGELMAIMMATKLLAPNIIGWWADKTGRHVRIIRFSSFVSAFVFVAMFFVTGYWSIAIVMSVFTFFWNASLPQFEAITLNYLGDNHQRYSQIRLWGSIGFVVSVILLGRAIDISGVFIVPATLFVLYCGIWLTSLSINEPPVYVQNETQQKITCFLRKPGVIAFFIACFLMQLGHGIYYTFYSLYLDQLGYSKSLIGLFWAIGVLAEILLFVVMHHLLKRYSPQRILFVSLLVASLRWLLTGHFSDIVTMVVMTQILHAATFGAYHASAIAILHSTFPKNLQGQAQALYSSLSFGAGGAVGSLTGGYVWDFYGPTGSFEIAAMISIVGAIVVYVRVLQVTK